MDKGKLHHWWRKLQRLSYWYFLILAVVSGIVFVLAYRNNNLTALRLRDQLMADDRTGTHVEESLRKLRVYTYGHMNANLAGGPGAIYPPIQLQGTYERLVAEAKQQADIANAKATADGQQVCEQQFPGERNGYLLCVQNYQAAHLATPQQIPDSLYKFDFVAPRWSPDLAGWSLVVTVLFFVLFIVRLLLEVWLRLTLHHHA